MSHWMEDADRVHKGLYLIGEDDDGDLCAPTRQRFPDGQRVWRRTRFPWLRLLSSRVQGKVIWLDRPSAILEEK
jgi:hypothetical protein